MYVRCSCLLLFVLHFLVKRADCTRTTCPQVRKCLPLLKSGKKCALFPMLPGSFTAPPGPSGYILTKLRPGVYHYNDDSYHSLLVYSAIKSHLVVIDFPRSPNALRPDGSLRLYSAVRAFLKGRVPKRMDMVYSHRHVDHIGLAGVFLKAFRSDYPKAHVDIWASAEVKQYITRRGFKNVPLPTKLLQGRARTIVLTQSLKVRLSIVGGHTSSDLLAYIAPSRKGRKDGVVHLADVISSKEVPFAQFTLTTDLWEYMRAHEALLKLDFAYLSTGHGRVGDKQDVKTSLAYVRYVIAAVQRAAANLDPEATGRIFSRAADPRDSAYRNGVWTLRSVIDLQVAGCVRDVVAEWGCKLSVIDIFVEGHCLSAAHYLLVDA